MTSISGPGAVMSDEKCGFRVGRRPEWMGVDQYDPCYCIRGTKHGGECACSHTIEDVIAAREAAARKAGAAEVSGDTSDGHHTFDELYEYRMLYNAHAAHGWLAGGIPVVKSWRHSDGEECFGGGWFVVVATLPTGQVSNHYRAEHWGIFHVPEVALPPEYDGHSPADAAARLLADLGGGPS